MRLQRSLLIEHLEWLLKIGYTVDDIVKWTLAKQSQQISSGAVRNVGTTCTPPKPREQQADFTAQPDSATVQETAGRKSDGSEVLSTPTQTSTPSSIIPSPCTSTPQRRSKKNSCYVLSLMFFTEHLLQGTRKRKKNLPWTVRCANAGSGHTGSSKQPRPKRARSTGKQVRLSSLVH